MNRISSLIIAFIVFQLLQTSLDAQGKSPLQHGDMVYLHTRRNLWLNAAGGSGPVRLSGQRIPNPIDSDEIWWIERHSGPGVVQHGDAIYLRTRRQEGTFFYYLNSPGGDGPVRVQNNKSTNAQESDELWWLDRHSGSGQLLDGDALFLRTRKRIGDTSYYLNSPGGDGPVRVQNNLNTNPQESDEIWWIDKVSPVVHNYTFTGDFSAAEMETIRQGYYTAWWILDTCDTLKPEEKANIRNAFGRPIVNGITTDAEACANARLNGQSVNFNRSCWFGLHRIARAQVVLHELCHSAGYNHPKYVRGGNNADYFRSIPVSGEMCFGGPYLRCEPKDSTFSIVEVSETRLTE